MAKRRNTPKEESGRERLRAPNGAGHLEKVTLKNGQERWYWERDFGTSASGKRIRPRFSGASLSEVMEKADKFAKGLSPAGPLNPKKMTVEEYLLRWLQDNPGRCRESTLQGYEQKIRIYILPGIRRIDLLRLHRAHVVSLYSALEKSGIGERALQYVHAVLHKALNDAIGFYGLLEQNPADKVKVARPQPQEGQVIPPEQIGEVVKAMRDDWLFPFYFLSLLTGCRRGELCGLKWADVDLDSRNPSIHVRNSMTQLRKDLGGKRLGRPKTDNSRRTVVIPYEAVNLLREHRKLQALMRQRHGPTWNQENMVFTGPVGSPLSPSTASQHWARLRERLGLPKVRLHDLRHSHATLLLRLGVPMKVVQRRLGHKNISVTMDIYSHVTDSMEADMLEKLSTATSLHASK